MLTVHVSPSTHIFVIGIILIYRCNRCDTYPDVERISMPSSHGKTIYTMIRKSCGLVFK